MTRLPFLYVLLLRYRAWVLPARVALASAMKWSVVLHAAETLRPSKTGEFDESLVLDNPEFSWAERVLRDLKEGREDSAWVFELAQNEWSRTFSEAAEETLGVDGPAPVLYHL